jgi:hypothetical protein
MRSALRTDAALDNHRVVTASRPDMHAAVADSLRRAYEPVGRHVGHGCWAVAKPAAEGQTPQLDENPRLKRALVRAHGSAATRCRHPRLRPRDSACLRSAPSARLCALPLKFEDAKRALRGRRGRWRCAPRTQSQAAPGRQVRLRAHLHHSTLGRSVLLQARGVQGRSSLGPIGARVMFRERNDSGARATATRWARWRRPASQARSAFVLRNAREGDAARPRAGPERPRGLQLAPLLGGKSPQRDGILTGGGFAIPGRRRTHGAQSSTNLAPPPASFVADAGHAPVSASTCSGRNPRPVWAGLGAVPAYTSVALTRPTVTEAARALAAPSLIH